MSFRHFSWFFRYHLLWVSLRLILSASGDSLGLALAPSIRVLEGDGWGLLLGGFFLGFGECFLGFGKSWIIGCFSGPRLSVFHFERRFLSLGSLGVGAILSGEQFGEKTVGKVSGDWLGFSLGSFFRRLSFGTDSSEEITSQSL